VPQLVLVALVVSTAGVVFDIGNSTLLPSIVSRDELTARNSLTSASVSATQLCGPALGGALVQLAGAATSLIFDVASYLVSAVMLRTLPRPRRLTPAKPDSSVRGAIREGWRFVTGHPVIRPCVLDATVINFVCGGLMTLTPVFLVRTLHASPALVGVLIAAEGAGSLVGATITPPDLLPRVMATVRFISWGAVPLGALGCGAAASLLGPRTALWLDCAVI